MTRPLDAWRISRVAFVSIVMFGAAGFSGYTPLAAAEGGGGVLMGVLSRAEIEQTLPDWVGETVTATPDVDTSMAFRDVVPGAKVTVFFGSWCEDSRRELARLWKALDLAFGDVAFEIEYAAIDRDKREPKELLADREILYVPTFVVERDGEEIGRIIEQPPVSIERDLLAILEGSASGWTSARDDLPLSVHGSSR